MNALSSAIMKFFFLRDFNTSHCIMTGKTLQFGTCVKQYNIGIKWRSSIINVTELADTMLCTDLNRQSKMTPLFPWMSSSGEAGFCFCAVFLTHSRSVFVNLVIASFGSKRTSNEQEKTRSCNYYAEKHMKFTSRIVLKSLNPNSLQTLIIPHSVSLLEDHFPTLTIALGIQHGAG